MRAQGDTGYAAIVDARWLTADATADALGRAAQKLPKGGLLPPLASQRQRHERSASDASETSLKLPQGAR